MGDSSATSDDAYLILLGSDGVVRWLHSGVPNDEAFEDLAAVTRELLAWR